jgi:hypothetical protein
LFGVVVLFVWCCCVVCLVFSRTSAEGADADGSENEIKQEMADSRRNLIFRIFDRVGRARGN